MRRYIFIGPILITTIWSIVDKLNLVDKFFLPSPSSTIMTLLKLIYSGSIIPDTTSTLERVIWSFFIAVIVGLPSGLILGISGRIYLSLEFVIDLFRSTPPTALFPLFILIFGIKDESKIAAAAFTSALLIIFNTAHGVRHAKKSRLKAAQIMGATKPQIFRWILFWESMPQTFVGLRSALSVCLIVIIVTEMFIGTPLGLGRKIIDAQMTYEVKTMYATIIFAGLIGYLLNLFFIFLEKRVLHWSGK